MSIGSAATLVFGVALVAATSWLSERSSRVLGALFLALASGVVLRFGVGPTLALLSGAAIAAAAWRWAPTLVLRRVTFLVPALVLP